MKKKDKILITDSLVARAKSQEGLDIELVKVDEISKRFREGFIETLKSI